MNKLDQNDKNSLKNINLKIGLTFFAIFALIITILLTVTSLIFQNIIKSSENRLSENITNVLSISISRISFSGKYHAQIFSDQLIERESSIKYITIIGSNGEIISNSYNPKYKDFIEKTHLEELKAYTSQIPEINKFGKKIAYIHTEGQEIKEIAMPYYGSFDQGQIGVIITGISSLQTTREIANSRLVLIILGFIVTVIGVVLIYIMTRKISSPILRLATMFQGLLNFAPMSVLVKDRQGNIIATSEEYKNIFIKNASELDKEEVNQIFGTENDFDPSVTIKQTFIKKNISTRHHEDLTFLTFKFPLQDANGKVYAICGMATDITGRERAEKALLKSEADYRSIFELSPVGIANVAPNGYFIRANQAFENILGYTETELKDLTFVDITHPDELNLSHQIQKSFKNKEHDHLELQKRYISKNKQVVWAQVYLSAVRNEKGELLHNIIIIEDVTEKKMAQDARDRLLVQEQEARLEAQKAVQARDEFLSIASHELKTPLTALTLQIQLLNRLVEQDRLIELTKEKRTDLIRLSDQHLDRFSKLVNDLLDVSRISSGKLILNKEEINLTELVKEMVKRFHMELQGSDCTVELKGDAQVMGHWERLRIEQVIINLLSNAIKFGTGKRIIVTTTTEGEMARLMVQDFGIGISKEDQLRIFDRFERAVSSKSFGGLGLGLYIVRQIVEGHGGTIRVVSEPEKGSTFIIELPLT